MTEEKLRGHKDVSRGEHEIRTGKPAPGSHRSAASGFRLVAAAAASLCLLTSCGRGSSTAFNIAGSTSVQPYVEILAEEYERLYPDMIIDVQGGGSSAGIQAVETGTAEIGMSSRNLKEAERYLWSIEIAKDGLAIIVNPRNPVDNLSISQLRGIYAAEYVNWKELGGPDHRIHVITREEGSGTRSAFEEMVMGEVRIDPRSIVQDSNGAVRQLVADDPSSIGFISLGLVEIGEMPVKALQINHMTPSCETVVSGDYALYRSFLLVARTEPAGTAMRFIEYIRSPDGQRLLAAEGLIPE